MQAVRIFRENGIVPIAVSLSDIPHYLAEMAILACAGKTEQQARPRSYEEVPESWVEAMGVIRELTAAGAFADNASATYESASTALFLQKKRPCSWTAAGLFPRFRRSGWTRWRCFRCPPEKAEARRTAISAGFPWGFI